MKVKGPVTFAYGEDRSKLPQEAVEVSVYLTEEGRLIMFPKEVVNEKEIIETSFQNETGLYIYI